MPVVSIEAVQSQLERILASPVFARSERLSRFFRYVVERSLNGAQESLKEYRIGVDVFDRGEDFDPRLDNIVRSHAHRLRTVLTAYYENEGQADAVVITLQKGSYAPLIELRGEAAAPQHVIEPLPEPPAKLKRKWMSLVIMLGGVLVGALGTYFYTARAGHTMSAGNPMELTLDLPPELRLDSGVGVLSPDSAWLVFPAVDASGVSRFWLRTMRSGSARPLNGTEGAMFPFWSPDGRSIAFFSAHKLKRMRVPDGPIQIIADAPMGRGGNWGEDGVILFSPQTSDPLLQVAETGLNPHPATQLDSSRQEHSHRWPFFLPGGKEYLFCARSGIPGQSGFFVGSLGSTATRRVLAQDAISNVVVAGPPGSGRSYLLYVRNGNLLAHGFNRKRGETVGTASTLATGLPVPSAGAPFTAVGNVIIYARARKGAPSRLAWYSHTGQALGFLGTPGEYKGLEISPDGSLVAFERLEEQYGTFDIWTLDTARGIENRITSDPANDMSPVWSPDGSKLTYSTEKTGLGKLAQKTINGGAAVENVLKSCCAQFASHWTRDGILFAEDHPKSHMDLALLRPDGNPVTVAASEANERTGRLSPDGALVAYESDKSGSVQVHVRPLESGKGEAGDRQASANGGIQPRWSPDGRELYYLTGLQAIMAVEVRRKNGRLELGTPRELVRPGGRITSFTVSPDGRRFLLNIPVGAPPPIKLTLLLNWASDLP